ncbi:MAG: hypothetical protein KatS3mg122_0200 [Caldimonas sp.]|nr:MAG: hypothetical protein KatS3mg122_0200 [Caldimonas sp.]
MSTDVLRTALKVWADSPGPVALYARTVRPAPGMLFRAMPEDAASAARELFAALRDFDARGARIIWVESPPPGPEWDGVRDRLIRAAAA